MKSVLLIFLSFLYFTSFEQMLPVPRNLQKAYLNQTRSPDGRPGKKYWQNKADYKILVSFDPVSRLLSGNVNILYTNSSPDTLRQVVFKLYPNYYKKGSPRNSRIAAEDISDGISIDTMFTNNILTDKSKIQVDGTNMVVGRLNILPGQNIQFRISYHYLLNKGSHNRTGEVEPNAAFIAYFFPRVAVYDDVDGWNRQPYLGTQEFYNDFCNFDVAITVPANFLVWATGNLQNCSDVLSSEVCSRLEQAEKNDGVTTIIDSTDVRSKITKQNSFNSWHFSALNVPDFVFATSDHYLWKSTSLIVDPATKRRTRVDAVFNQKHTDYFEVVSDARKTVEAMSYTFPAWPFPYSHVTVFDGLDQMEYPMMVNDNPLRNRHASIELTDHEVFHTMFPFYMGTNETKYAWMDEGWATIAEWLISPMIDTTVRDEYGVRPYELESGTENDPPITTLSTLLSGQAYFLNSYPKPAFGYLYIKDLLGDSLFTRALHFYIGQWNGKHPLPLDFFNSINQGAGRNLNWFWKRWFYENGFPDLAITSVEKKLKSYAITITMKGSKPVPVDINITFADLSTQSVHKAIDVWEKGNSTYEITIPTSKRITRITLGSFYVPDANHSDNVYEVK
jgi:hypothetical protein